MGGRTSAAVKNKYNAKAYDRVTIVLRKDGSITKDSIQAAADKAGESVTAYISGAVSARMLGRDDGRGVKPEPVKASQPDEQSAAAWYKPGAVLYIPIGAKTVAALERIAKAGESPLQCAARLLGDAIKAAPSGENGTPAQKTPVR